MNRPLKIVQILIIVLSFVSCSNNSEIKSGDIIFRGASESSLSEAINDVTQTSKATNYTHMGICEVEADKIIVYHSDLGKGVVRESLESFISSSDTLSFTVDIYRIKEVKQNQIENALKKAKSLLGEPYNTTYVLDDEGYYCSEFIFEIFKQDSIFTLEPMTFKNPKNNEFHKGWVEHYQELGVEIPEGKLGCNPNGMANSESLKFVKKLK